MVLRLFPMRLLVSSAKDTFEALKRYIISHTRAQAHTLRSAAAQNHTRLLSVRATATPSISYYLFLWPPIDQGRSWAAYDVLYYLGISVMAGCCRWD